MDNVRASVRNSMSATRYIWNVPKYLLSAALLKGSEVLLLDFSKPMTTMNVHMSLR